jgi:hypothetical protein
MLVVLHVGFWFISGDNDAVIEGFSGKGLLSRPRLKREKLWITWGKLWKTSRWEKGVPLTLGGVPAKTDGEAYPS